MDFSQTKVLWDNPSEIVFERKFDTAIRNSFHTKLLGSEDGWAFDESLFSTLMSTRCPLEDMSLEPTHFPLFLLKVLNRSDNYSMHKIPRSNIQRIGRLIKKTCEIQMRYCHKQNNLNHSKTNIFKMLASQPRSLPSTIGSLLTLSQSLSLLITKSNAMHSMKIKHMTHEDKMTELCKINRFVIPSYDIEFVWSHKYTGIHIDSTWYLVPKSVILMYHNKICDMVSVLSISFYSQGTSLPDDSYSIVVTFIHRLIDLLLKYQMKFFHIAKVLEALVVAETLLEIEDWPNREFLNVLTDDLRIQTGFDYETSSLRHILQDASIPLRHELSCLGKALGHPTVDMEGGAQALYSKTNEELEIDSDAIMQCINYCKRDYIKKTIHKLKKWPPCVINSAAIPKALQMAYIHGRDPDSIWIRNKYGQVDIRDYIFIDLTPNLKFTKLENIIPYLKDKTISLMRSAVVNKYINHHSRDKDGWKDTRLLLAYLLNPTMVHDHINYIDTYAASATLDELLDYLVIRVVPKEKELKEKFRGFGCKTFEDRARSLAQEKNVMRFLDEFSDEQAMTLSELALVKKLDAFRRMSSVFKDYDPLFIVIDSSSWNNMFRDVTVDRVMDHTLDPIFGTQIFGKTHLAFQKSLVYVPDAGITYYWEGQGGGIEGLNQDTWVVTYIAQMKVAVDMKGLRYHVLCKGDDLRMIFLIPKATTRTQSLKDIKKELVTQISITAKKFGHTVKIEESYGSSKYLAFSKEASITNILLPQTFRKIPKCHGSNNAFVNTLDDYIGSAMSNAHSACRTSPIVLPCYQVGILWCLWYLIHHAQYSQCSDNQLIGLMMIPNMLGGFPIIYLHNMAIRAESDLLSPFLDMLHFTKQSYPDIYDVLERFMYSPFGHPDSLKGLFKDSYSLPSSRPKLPSSILRASVIPALDKLTKNNDLRELIHLATSDENKTLMNCLESCNIVRARALSAIYAATPEGALDELVKKFENARSILDLVVLKAGPRASTRILRDIIKAEGRLQTWRIQGLNGLNQSGEQSLLRYKQDCPARWANTIRETLWGKPIHDVTMPPLQHQLSLTYAFTDQINDWASKNHFVYTIHPVSFSLPRDNSLHYQTSNRGPFMGYTTPLGSLTPNLHFTEKDVLVSKLKQLIDLVSWLNVEGDDGEGNNIVSNSVVLLEKIITSYTSIPLKELQPFQSVRRSGTQQHHLRGREYRASIIPNVLSNLYTRVSGESNTHITFRTTADHLMVNFLYIFCFSTWLLMGELEVGNVLTVPERTWGVTTACDFCTTPINEIPLRFDPILLDKCRTVRLTMTQIGYLSESIILESIDEHLERGLVNRATLEGRRNITLDIAATGILQEAMDSTYGDRVSVQERFSSHATNIEELTLLQTITQTQKKKTIGLTEVKSLTINQITEYLKMCIHYQLPKMTRNLTMEGVTGYILTTPVAEIPWYGLVTWLFQANRLGQVIGKLTSESDVVGGMCYYEPAAATRFIGITCWKSCLFMEIAPYSQCIHLSYYGAAHVFPHLTRSINQMFAHWIIHQFNMKDINNGLTSKVAIAREAALGLVMQMIIALVASLRSDLQLLEVSTLIIEEGLPEYQVLDLDRVCEEEIDNWIDELDQANQKPFIYTKIENLYRKAINIDNNFLTNLYDQLDDHKATLQSLPQLPLINIYVTSLDECITIVRQNRVNGHHREDDVDNPGQFPARVVDAGPFTNMYLNQINETILDGPMLVLDMGHEEGYIADGHINEVIVPPTFHYYLNPSWSYRTRGEGNSSATTALNFWNGFQLSRLCDNVVLPCVACFSDGIGGFLTVIDSKLRDSLLFWHTYPDNDTQEPKPVRCWRDAIHRNQILYSHIGQGIYDLSQLETWNAYKQLQDTYHIITCDMEVNISIQEEYSTYISDVSQRLLLFLERNGIIIIRVDLRFVLTILGILRVFRNLFNKTILWRPIHEVYPYNSYLIGYGYYHRWDEEGLKDIYLQSMGYSLQSIIPFNNYIESINLLLMTTNRSVYTTVDLSQLKPPTTRECNENYAYIPYYCSDLLMRHFGIVLELEIMDGVVKRDMAYQYNVQSWKRLGISFEALIKILLSVLNITTYTTGYNIRWDRNMRAHYIQYLRQLFMIYGYQFGISLYNGPKHACRVSTYSLYTNFSNYYKTLPDRHKHKEPFDIAMCQYPARDEHEADDYLWFSYLKGFNTFQSTLAMIQSQPQLTEREANQYHLEDIG